MAIAVRRDYSSSAKQVNSTKQHTHPAVGAPAVVPLVVVGGGPLVTPLVVVPLVAAVALVVALVVVLQKGACGMKKAVRGGALLNLIRDSDACRA